MSTTKMLALALSALALTAACSGSPGATQVGPASAAGAGAPAAGADRLAFTATTLDGKPFDGQSLRGKPTVMWFWAAWCSVCAGEAPAVAKVAAANPGVTVVGVSALDQPPAMRKFVTDHRLGGMTQLADPDAAVWQRFGVTSQPAHAFIAADGTTEVVTGAMSERELTERISALSKP